MSHDERIDVLVAASRAERWIGAAIDSVLAQRGVALGRLVVVVNGSPDGTEDIVRRYPPPVFCLASPEAHSAKARNRALDASDAPLLTHLDADDIMPPDSLACRLRALRAQDAEMVAGRVLSFRDGQPLPADCNAPELRAWSKPAKLLGCSLMRRSLYDRIGRFDESLVGTEGVDWVMRSARAAVQVAAVDQVVLLRRLHPESMSQTRAVQLRHEYLKLLRRHVGEGGSS